ncbi:MAG: sulfotransferase domain-containing protein [Spirosomataceae bacterium]
MMMARVNNIKTNALSVAEEGRIVWLASYPKSGNTWFRSFLTALQSGKEIDDLNQLKMDAVFSSKLWLESVLDLDSFYLSDNQIQRYRRLVYTYLSENASENFFVKIHDAFTFSVEDKYPLIPEEPSKLAIYFVRNPLDVALSLMNHQGKDTDYVIDSYINDVNGYFGEKKNSSNNQFNQPLGTWSMHVESWLTKPRFPVHFMRYEDMKVKPFETFKAAVEAIGMEVTDEQIQGAIEATEFEKLQKKEQEKGFKEKAIPTSNFFFKGQVGRWKEELTPAQIERIRTVNEPMMRHFGYWE